jgi:tetratricopeptide (TPR) repeat protein
MRRYSEAELLLVRSLQICETHLGSDDPNTAISLNNLALLYHEIERYIEAEPLYLKTLEIFVNCLGEDHPYTQKTRKNFCSLIQQVLELGGAGELSGAPITQEILKQTQEEVVHVTD